MDKIIVKQTIIVEGKYDKIKLQNFISSPIIETNGFRVFKDKEKQHLIREIANKRGILILTDSDSAGFVIRNFIKGIVGSAKIYNAYIPEILGKEKRKEEYSKEGLLGVEGISKDILIEAIKNSGATIDNIKTDTKTTDITYADFYDLGLVGQNDSKIKREEILKKMNLPKYLSTKAMICAINSLYTKEEFINNFI